MSCKLGNLKKRQTRMKVVKHEIYGERGVYLLTCMQNINPNLLRAIAVSVKYSVDNFTPGKIPRKIRIDKNTLLKVSENKERKLHFAINYKHKKPVLLKLAAALESFAENKALIKPQNGQGMKINLFLAEPVASELSVATENAQGPGYIAKQLGLDYSKESIRFYLTKPY